MITTDEIESEIWNMIDKYDSQSGLVDFNTVMSQFPVLGTAFTTKDVIFGSGNTHPSVPTSAQSISEFAQQYIKEHNLTALKQKETLLATELYDFYMNKFPTALYGLFSAVGEINRQYGGIDPEANQLSDMAIIPSFIQEATAPGDDLLPAGVTGDFTQPAVSFKQVLTNSSTTDSVTVGWVNKYFTIDTTLPEDKLYTGSPSLEKISAFIIFGVLDREGNVYGTKFVNAKNVQSKPTYYSETGLNIARNNGTAHILNNDMSMYVGQSTYGYVGIDIKDVIPKAGSITVDVDLLGHFFAISPVVHNNAY